VLWVMTRCGDVKWSHRKDGSTMALRNLGILPHHYTVSWLRRPRHGSPWKYQASHISSHSSQTAYCNKEWLL